MARQFVTVRFHANDRRTYTYHNDGEPVAVGEDVKVADRASDGWVRVRVTAVYDSPAPTFETKAILGKAPPAIGALFNDGEVTR